MKNCNLTRKSQSNGFPNVMNFHQKSYYHTDMVLQVTLSNWTKTVQVSHSVCVFREKTSHTLSLSQKNTKLKPCKLVMVPCIFLVYKQFAFSILSSHQFRIMFSLVLLIWLWSTLLHKNWTHSPLHHSFTYKVILFIQITIKTVSVTSQISESLSKLSTHQVRDRHHQWSPHHQ